tara:strand:- start:372 stop:500 length:129 start_codon:yes stop_codon:yes gene_type:complete
VISLKKDIKIKNGKTWGKKTVSRIIDRNASAPAMMAYTNTNK